MAKGDYVGASDILLKYLELDDPEIVALYESSEAPLIKKVEAKERSERKKQGVHIGMTQQQVIESNWGKPRKINRTTNSRGTA
jgi:hypothetical protein